MAFKEQEFSLDDDVAEEMVAAIEAEKWDPASVEVSGTVKGMINDFSTGVQAATQEPQHKHRTGYLWDGHIFQVAPS